MLYHNVHVFARALRFVDCALIGVASLAMGWAGGRSGLWQWGPVADAWMFAAWLSAAFFVISSRARTYHARRTEHLFVELVSLGGVTITSVGVACLMIEVTTAGLPGAWYGLTALAGVAILVGSRVFLRISLRLHRRSGKDTRQWLLVGRNGRASQLAREVMSNPHFGIRIAHVVDFPDPQGGPSPSRIESFDRGPLASIQRSEVTAPLQLQELLAGSVIDEVVITLPVRSFYDEIDGVMKLCTSAGLSVRFPPQAFDRLDARSEVSMIGAIPMVTHYNGPAGFMAMTLKRLLDCGVSGALLLVLSPMLACIAIAIKVTSEGPILFRQQRIGLHGRMFDMLKFRTMVVNASEMQQQLAEQNQVEWPAFKIQNDPRLTPIGRMLRKYHLDELPQLWNVFVGEMSLVGPRPIPLYAVDEKEWWHRRRHSVQPGLTCLWQIDDQCKQIPFKKWMELDLEYIDRWSIWLDCKVLCSTVRTVVRGGGW